MGYYTQDGPVLLLLAGGVALSADDSGGIAVRLPVPAPVVGLTLTALAVTPRYSGPDGEVGSAVNWLGPADAPAVDDPETWLATAYQGSGCNLFSGGTLQYLPHMITPTITLTPTGSNAAVTSEPLVVNMSCPTSRGFQPDFIHDGSDYHMWLSLTFYFPEDMAGTVDNITRLWNRPW